MSFRPVKTPALAEAVVAEFEELLLAGVLRPGDRLPPERELAEKLGVSRTTLREALDGLSRRGLIEKKQGSGAIVSELIASSLVDPLATLIAAQRDAREDYLAFRRLIESEGAALAARRATEQDRKAITAVLERMSRAIESEDVERAAALDMDLHMAIAEAAGNVVMLQVMRALGRTMRRGMAETRLRLYDAPGFAEAIQGQHAALVEAILARDPEGAKAASERHLDYVAKALREAESAARRADLAARRHEGRAEE